MHHQPPDRSLPQLDGRPFLTDGGIETQLMFLEGLDLPDMAAFTLLRDVGSAAVVERVLRQYASVARQNRLGVILESVTWRASRDWGRRLGYSDQQLAGANVAAVDMLRRIRADLATDATPVVISGNIGPRGDGYVPGRLMSPGEAQQYHAEQARTLADAGVDCITGLTLNYVDEAIGFARAALATGRPCVVAFTVKTDGHLPDGTSLQQAIEAVDAATGGCVAYFMINCAHPSHFEDELSAGGSWVRRIQGLRANASCKSHAELDESDTLDRGDPDALAAAYRSLRSKLPHLNVLGGCCGTDAEHVAAIARACFADDAAAVV